ncbi:MAG: choice-of-anchor tandem repeat GloVer-containing protein [Verrucomicrobiota bacterium]
MAVTLALLFGVLVTAHSESTLLKSFGHANLSGANSRAALSEGDSGDLFGTTEYGGQYGMGTVFKVNRAGTNYQVLLSFSGTNGDGARPYAGLLKGSNGIFYGTTCYGGSNDAGTVFRLASEGGNYIILKHFFTNGLDGRYPRAELILASDGKLYGTTYGGGASNRGTLFRLDPDGANYAIVKSFTGRTNDGGKPFAAVIEGSQGVLFGTTFVGGITNRGTIFSINKDGSGFAVLRSFMGTGTTIEGRFPCASLMLGGDGLLYGCTRKGGLADMGTVFRLNQNGSGYAVVANFTNTAGGRYPHARLLEGSDGALYGTTYQGGTNNVGTIFKLAKDGGGGIQELTNFFGIYANGAHPEAGLIKGSDGILYGTTYRGGASDYGTIFGLPEGGGLFSPFLHFSVSGGDGSYPGTVFQSSSGVVYGITEGGGSNDLGTIFSMNPDGNNAVVLHHFTSTNGDGCYPSMLRESGDGMLYGVTYSGGFSNYGTVFRVSTNGDNYSVLKSFTSAGGDGRNPYTIMEAGGILYGATYRGGASERGTVFRLDRDGSNYSVVCTFLSVNGSLPGLGLTVDANGMVYGTTCYGGTASCGLIYAANTNTGTVTVLKTFTGGTDGCYPWGALVLNRDGMLYGTAMGDTVGLNGNGILYRISTNGSGYAILRRFGGINSVNGGNPWSGLVQASNGYFYGITDRGGSNDVGTVCLFDKTGNVQTVVQHFAPNTLGCCPQSGLTMGRSGRLYGSTVQAGGMDFGTLYSLTACVAASTRQQGSQIMLTLQGAANQAYVVQRSHNLLLPDWETFGSNTLNGDGAIDIFLSGGTNAAINLYRTITP